MRKSKQNALDIIHLIKLKTLMLRSILKSLSAKQN